MRGKLRNHLKLGARRIKISEKANEINIFRGIHLTQKL